MSSLREISCRSLFTLVLAFVINLALLPSGDLSAESPLKNDPNAWIDKTYIESSKQPGFIELREQDNFLLYSGMLNKLNNEKLFDFYANSKPVPTWLAINSGGGSVEYGLELGEWIHDNKLNVYIPGYCTSSCANYVFTAGVKVVLTENTVIGWHGGPVVSDLVAGTQEAKDLRQSAIKLYEKWHPEITNPRRHWDSIRIRSRRFFRTVGVHPIITSLRVVADKTSVAKIDGSASGSYINYLAYISLEDMKYFGVDNVVIDNDTNEWNPRAEEGSRTELIKVTLAKDIESRLAEIKHQLNQVE